MARDTGLEQTPELEGTEEALREPSPTEFEDGFSLKTVLGALFIALFMLPGGMYLGLVAGQGVGDAAEWVTIVLFAEVARRSYSPLRKQEIYMLFYIAASLTGVVNAQRGLGGGPFANLIWNAYFVGSQPAKNIADQIPPWAVPKADSAAVAQRALWFPEWWQPIALLVINEICGRLSWMGMGYALFRITSDVERLPFPYAPVAASGATALSEAGTETWRWGVFSFGSVIGLFFGALYVGVPVLTGTMLGKSFEIFPIPFADYTTNIENILPTAIVGLSFSLGNILLGFVLPWEIVLGAAVASVLGMVVMNPILHHLGMLPSWRPGSSALVTKLSIDMDFWLSIGIGINIGVALIGGGLVLKAVKEAKRNRRERAYTLAPPPGRGDVHIGIALGAWALATAIQTALCAYLIPSFPIWIVIFFGFLWTPLNSYISARMIGLTGRGISFPFLKEASVVATGYPRVDVWYAPIPMADHGGAAQRFREIELTGTKFSSVVKAEILMFFLIVPMSFFFWSFFWHQSPIPSPQFPYALRFWPIEAQGQAVFQQLNLPSVGGAENYIMKAIKPPLIAIGAAFGVVTYAIFNLFKLPLLFYYGFAGGLGLFPANTLPQLLGAWIGKRFLARRYGEENWRRYAPVLLAGFACGTGLMSLVSIAIALIGKAVQKLPY